MGFHCPHIIGYTGNTSVTDEYFLLQRWVSCTFGHCLISWKRSRFSRKSSRVQLISTRVFSTWKSGNITGTGIRQCIPAQSVTALPQEKTHPKNPLLLNKRFRIYRYEKGTKECTLYSYRILPKTNKWFKFHWLNFGTFRAMDFHCPHIIRYTGNTSVTDEYFLLQRWVSVNLKPNQGPIFFYDQNLKMQDSWKNLYKTTFPRSQWKMFEKLPALQRTSSTSQREVSSIYLFFAFMRSRSTHWPNSIWIFIPSLLLRSE